MPRMASYADGRRDPATWEQFRNAPVGCALAETVLRTGEPIAADRDSGAALGLVGGQLRHRLRPRRPLGRAPHLAGVLTLDSSQVRPFSEDVRRLGGRRRRAPGRRHRAAARRPTWADPLLPPPLGRVGGQRHRRRALRCPPPTWNGWRPAPGGDWRRSASATGCSARAAASPGGPTPSWSSASPRPVCPPPSTPSPAGTPARPPAAGPGAPARRRARRRRVRRRRLGPRRGQPRAHRRPGRLGRPAVAGRPRPGAGRRLARRLPLPRHAAAARWPREVLVNAEDAGLRPVRLRSGAGPAGRRRPRRRRRRLAVRHGRDRRRALPAARPGDGGHGRRCGSWGRDRGAHSCLLQVAESQRAGAGALRAAGLHRAPPLPLPARSGAVAARDRRPRARRARGRPRRRRRARPAAGRPG